MTTNVRVRYAPSPTGDPHIGNIRTAIFNWLFARSQNGRFIVRIEDTDQKRTIPGAVDTILHALEWLGIEWDEGPKVGGQFSPYIQSERLESYWASALRLVDNGKAYYCACSPDRLLQVRLKQQELRLPPKYDRHCRDLNLPKSSGLPNPVIRFKMPLDGTIVFRDAIRGDVKFDTNVLDDFVILKSDEFPTYHLASTVDDHTMAISHVMRAEEWLPSAPKHQLLYEALGFPMPEFVHLPIILGTDKSKLSKRHGATSIMDFQKMGYLPEAMINFMALLGWSLDDKTDIISVNTLVENFSIERIGASPAIFDREKLNWLNGIYIRQLSTTSFIDRVLPFLGNKPDSQSDLLRSFDRAYFEKVIPLVQERVKFLSEVPEATSFFFKDTLDYKEEDLNQKDFNPDQSINCLLKTISILEKTKPFQPDTIESNLRELAISLELKPGQLFGLIRIALTASKATPPLFTTIEALGVKRCVKRLTSAANRLGQLKKTDQ